MLMEAYGPFWKHIDFLSEREKKLDILVSKNRLWIQKETGLCMCVYACVFVCLQAFYASFGV